MGPSPRERIGIEQHVRLDSYSNIKVERVALGASRGEAELFLGYEAPETVRVLHLMGSRWYRVNDGGMLQWVDSDYESYNANLIAILALLSKLAGESAWS